MQGVREIVFDTETTGFDAKGDDRITEIGCVEILDLMPTGNTFHAYINPERDIPDKVTEITGLTREFLEDKPLFSERAQDFIAFVGDSQMIAHNADFDRGFINAELKRAGFDPYPKSRFTDTLKMARAKFPGSPASLDALCKRFQVSLKSRNKHGALIDSELLAEVYLELKGGRARTLGFSVEPEGRLEGRPSYSAAQRPKPLPALLSEAEKTDHRNFIQSLTRDDVDMVWNRYFNSTR